MNLFAPNWHTWHRLAIANNVRRNRSYFSYAVVIGLGATLVVLAMLQYRWSNQVSQAESDRMKDSLRIASTQFRQDFSRELQTLSSGLQPDADILSEDDWHSYAAQSADWLKNSTYPDLVATLYLWRSDKPLLRLDRKAKVFEAVEAQASLTPIIDRIRQQTDPSRQGRAFRPQSWSMDGNVPALFHGLYIYPDPEVGRPPKPPALAGFTIVLLNRSFIESKFLPDLATRHFGGPDGFLYQVGVFTAGDANHPIYQSGPPLGQKAIAAADVTMDLLSDGRPRQPGQNGSSRGAAANQSLDQPGNGPPPGDTRGDRKGPPSDRPRNEEGRAGGFGGGRGQRRTGFNGPGGDRQPNAGARNAFAFQERLRMARRLGVAPPAQPIVTDSRSAWQLVVRHRAGSVDAAVAELRMKNLAVSFAILLLLGVSMALIVMTSQRAQRLARLQMEFVAGVSHELRTPLAVISSAADNLTDGIIESKPQVKLYGTLIRNEARRLEGMMEQILDFASGQKRRTYDPKILSVPDLVESALTFCSATIQDAGFSVEKNIAPDLTPVLAEEHGLLQCLQNLIVNAVKYGGEKRWIGVNARMDAGSVTISVTDRGLGIDSEDLPYIFDAFYRARAVTEAQIHGTGLGLSLAKSFAQAAGGNISVISSQGEGTCFTLRLPAAKPAVEATQQLLAGRTV
jgi:two-component system sensor histidine kinase SenX3